MVSEFFSEYYTSLRQRAYEHLYAVLFSKIAGEVKVVNLKMFVLDANIQLVCKKLFIVQR